MPDTTDAEGEGDCWRETAIHEAAHAVVGELLGRRVLRACVGEGALPHYAGLVEFEADDGDLVRDLSVFLAGPAAELHLGVAADLVAGGGDRALAGPLLRQFLTEGGRAAESLERALAGLYLHPALWRVVEDVADALGRAPTMSGAAVRRCIAGSLGDDYDLVARFVIDFCRAAVAGLFE